MGTQFFMPPGGGSSGVQSDLKNLLNDGSSTVVLLPEGFQTSTTGADTSTLITKWRHATGRGNFFGSGTADEQPTLATKDNVLRYNGRFPMVYFGTASPKFEADKYCRGITPNAAVSCFDFVGYMEDFSATQTLLDISRSTVATTSHLTIQVGTGGEIIFYAANNTFTQSGTVTSPKSIIRPFSRFHVRIEFYWRESNGGGRGAVRIYNRAGTLLWTSGNVFASANGSAQNVTPLRVTLGSDLNYANPYKGWLAGMACYGYTTTSLTAADIPRVTQMTSFLNALEYDARFIVAVGDSITQGVGNPDQRRELNLNWPAQMQSALRSSGVKTADFLWNLGIAGDRCPTTVIGGSTSTVTSTTTTTVRTGTGSGFTTSNYFDQADIYEQPETDIGAFVLVTTSDTSSTNYGGRYLSQPANYQARRIDTITDANNLTTTGNNLVATAQRWGAGGAALRLDQSVLINGIQRGYSLWATEMTDRNAIATSSRTAAQVKTQFYEPKVELISAITQAGFKVITTTPICAISNIGDPENATNYTYMANINELASQIRVGYNSGDFPAYGLMDINADPSFNDFHKCLDTTLFAADAIHPVTYGHRILGGLGAGAARIAFANASSSFIPHSLKVDNQNLTCWGWFALAAPNALTDADADRQRGAQLNSTTISRWNNQAYGLMHLTQATAANQPTFTLDADGYYKAVFDGSNDNLGMITGYNFLPFLSGITNIWGDVYSGKITLIFVAEVSASGDQYLFSCGPTANNRLSVVLNSAGSVKLIARRLDADADTTTSYSTTITVGTKYIIGVDLDPATKTANVYKNGTLVSQDTTALGSTGAFDATAITKIFLGRDFAGAAFLNGAIREAILFEGILTAAEHSRVAHGLNQKANPANRYF